jgi:LEA14-like dessication related protein
MKPVTKRWLWIGFGTAIVLAVSIPMYRYFKKQIALAKEYCYKIKKFTVKKATQSELSFEAILGVYNFSKIDAMILGYDLQVFINKKNVANLKNSNSQKINPESATYLNLNIYIKDPIKIFSLADLLLLVKNIGFSREKVIISVVGNIEVQSGFLKKNIEIDYTQNLKELTAPSPEDVNKKSCPL